MDPGGGAANRGASTLGGVRLARGVRLGGLVVQPVLLLAQFVEPRRFGLGASIDLRLSRRLGCGLGIRFGLQPILFATAVGRQPRVEQGALTQVEFVGLDPRAFASDGPGGERVDEAADVESPRRSVWGPRLRDGDCSAAGRSSPSAGPSRSR